MLWKGRRESDNIEDDRGGGGFGPAGGDGGFRLPGGSFPGRRGGGMSIGTLIVVDMATRVDVDAFLAHEPYKRAGLFAHCEVYPYQLIVERGQPCQ